VFAIGNPGPQGYEAAVTPIVEGFETNQGDVMKKVIVYTVGAVLILEVLAVWVFAGMMDISAAKKEGTLTQWFLTSVRDRSVRSHAADIKVPALTDSAMILKGFGHYHEMCVMCHGAPGEEPGELAAGLNPRAPLLAEGSGSWSDAEKFVIIKNGIKMTGMPAWGPTHDDSAIWSIVAFVNQLPTMTPQEYEKFEKLETGDEEMEGAHQHRQ
jgi:mono/diheme cytochrome c family protein